MVMHWRRHREPGWHLRALINALGAIATAVVLVVFVTTKFREGRVGRDGDDPVGRLAVLDDCPSLSRRPTGNFRSAALRQCRTVAM